MRRIALCAVVASAACTDPDVKCESVRLSVDSATIFFRERVTVSATPFGHLDSDIEHNITWSSTPAGIVDLVPTSPDGNIVQLRPTGIGSAVIRAACANATKTLTVTVPDTAHAVAVFPSGAQLTVGDTITLTAQVLGPANVFDGIRWHVPTGATVAFLSKPDSTSVLIQVNGTSPAIIARARADSTKSASPTMSAGAATLAFVVQPSNVNKGLFIGPAVKVEIRNTSGTASVRSGSTIFLAPALDGSCSAGMRVTGRGSKAAVSGVATFDNLGLDRTGSCTLVATASTAAAAATSAVFIVGPRGCGPVPYTLGDTVPTLIEGTDCKVSRNGNDFYVHRYSVAVPGGAALRARLRLSSDFGPRLESNLWVPDTAVWVDSAAAPGTLDQYYDFGDGTYVISVSTHSPGVTGEYSLVASNTQAFGTNNGCRYLVARGSFNRGNPHSCVTEFLSFGSGPGRTWRFYLPAGATTTITAGPQDPNTDPYLEVVEITNGTRTLIGADDDGGGGVNAKVEVSATGTGRWIEALSTRRKGPVGSTRVTIP